MRLLLAAVVAGTLAGCSALPGFMHRQEGGEIAKPLQPPPGLNKPYPNLASVPARPAPPDQAALQRLSQSLIADRENARHQTVTTPDPSLPAASPGLFGVGSLPPPAAAGSAAATLAAVQGPTPSATAAPAAKPPRPQPSARPGAPPIGRTPVTAASLPAPNLPAEAPAPPGIGAGAASAVAASTGAQAPASPPANPATTVAVSFPPASAVLPAEAADALHALARRRGTHAIAVVGHGDATSPDPDAQSQAVALGLQRAQAITQALAAAGVPDSAMRLDAQAGGQGGSARLVD